MHVDVKTIFCRSVQHPHILSLLGAVFEETRLIILTNIVNGKNLQQLIFDPSVERVSTLIG